MGEEFKGSPGVQRDPDLTVRMEGEQERGRDGVGERQGKEGVGESRKKKRR